MSFADRFYVPNPHHQYSPPLDHHGCKEDGSRDAAITHSAAAKRMAYMVQYECENRFRNRTICHPLLREFEVMADGSHVEVTSYPMSNSLQ